MPSFLLIYKRTRRYLRLLPCFILPAVFSVLQPDCSFGQSPINYVEYYVNQDPGIGKGISIPVTSGTSITNSTFNVDVSVLPQGVHILAARARTVAGTWGMSHYWFIFKPYTAITPAAAANISKVEYFIDTDPGLGNGTPISITAGITLADVAFTINPGGLSKGAHILGARALGANGVWSFTNYWLFQNAFENTQPASTPTLTGMEYYVDQDPGIGKAIAISIPNSTNVTDNNFVINTTPLTRGTHIVSARAKDDKGSWSFTNYWLLVKPFDVTQAGTAPNMTAMEYYLDYDPGVGRGTAVPITPGTNFTDLSFNVDVSNLIPGNHFIVARVKDANGNWSMVNNWPFTKDGTAPKLSTIVSTTTLCAGSSLNVGYQLSQAVVLNANNQFIAQLSDRNGSFAQPTTIGTINSTNNTTNSFTCTIPDYVEKGGWGYSYYRIRVISTSQSIVGSDNSSNITIYGIPYTPTIVSPAADSTVCQGNTLTLRATSENGNYQWLLNGNAIANANANIYTVPNATALNEGAYSIRVNNVYTPTCNIVTAVRNIAINTNVSPVPTLSPSGSIGICLGDSRLLTASAAAVYQWKKDGENIPNATGAAYNATQAGTYTVATGNGAGCFSGSSNNAVVTLGLSAIKPTIVASGPISFCNGGSAKLTSSAFTGNQWYRNGVPQSNGLYPDFYAYETGYYKTLVSGGGCEILSDSILITAKPVVTPTLGLDASGNNMPAGSSITFTATPANGGTAPEFNFKVNGSSVQKGASNTYTTSSLVQGNTVTCEMASNAPCINTAIAYSATISINIAVNKLISGRVYHSQAGNIPAVTIRFSNGVTDSTVTVGGSYGKSLFQQRNYTVTPSKNNDQQKANGVNVLDVLQMQSHIVGSTLLNSPYKIIAADANSDGTVNIFDVLAVKRLILGIDTTFAGSKLWSFVDSTYSFPNAANPFPYASTKSYSNLASDQANQSFIGVKLGDVTQDWNPGIAGAGRDEALETSVRLYYDTTYVESDDAVRIRIRVRDFKALYGMQFTLGFNADAFQFTGIQNKALPFSYNENAADKGVISFIWADAANAMNTLKDGTAIFDLVLRKKQGFLKEDIRLNNAFTPAIAFTNGYEAQNVLMNSGIILGQAKTPTVFAESLEVSPNPSNGIVKIVTNAKAGKKVELTVTDVAGRIVLTQTMEVNPGVNTLQLNLRRQSGLAPGVYYLHNQGLEKVGVKVLMIKDK